METPELRSLPNSDVLGHLLHSLCQPLTTLRCSLELSLDEFTDQQCESVSAALEQADRAIETVQLMREYLELEHGQKPVASVALAPAVHTVLEQLSVVAEAHGIPLLASGTTTAVLGVNEFWLHRALRYLIGALLEVQSRGDAIAILLEDGPSRTFLSLHRLPCKVSKDQQSEAGIIRGHLRQARLEIARHVFESAGATVDFYSAEHSGFLIGIPQASAIVRRISA